MPLSLKENWAILTDSKYFYLLNLDYPMTTWWSLDWSHFLVLSSLDRLEAEKSIVSKVSSVLKISIEFARQIFEQVIYRYHHCLVESKSPHPPAVYRSKELLPVTERQRIRNCAPLRLTWVATILCLKQCKYCYMAASPVKPNDQLSLPLENLRELAVEASQLAIPELVITGGEPFVLTGISDAINVFIEQEIHVTVGTKAYVDCSQLSSRASCFLTVEQSLDSTDRSLVAYLTGRRHAFDEAIASMRQLAKSHIPFRVKMVVGRANVNSVPQMAALCKELGAGSCQVVEYRPSLGRNLPGFELDDALRTKLVDDIVKASKQFHIPIETDLVQPNRRYAASPGSYCGEGIKSLSFLPDGTCTRCPALPSDQSIACGNVLHDGIYTSWNYNKRYESLAFPDRQLYHQTACYSCSKLDACNHSGRCVIRSLQASGRHFGPDRTCTPDPISASVFVSDSRK